MSYYPEPGSHSKSEIQIELDFPNYAKGIDVEKAAGVDISDFVKKVDLASNLRL